MAHMNEIAKELDNTTIQKDVSAIDLVPVTFSSPDCCILSVYQLKISAEYDIFTPTYPDQGWFRPLNEPIRLRSQVKSWRRSGLDIQGPTLVENLGSTQRNVQDPLTTGGPGRLESPLKKGET